MKLVRLVAIPGNLVNSRRDPGGRPNAPRAAHAAAASQHAAINCEYSSLCAEVGSPADVFGSEYVGHDEPSAVFYSNMPGAGNHMTVLAAAAARPLAGQPEHAR